MLSLMRKSKLSYTVHFYYRRSAEVRQNALTADTVTCWGMCNYILKREAEYIGRYQSDSCGCEEHRAHVQGPEMLCYTADMNSKWTMSMSQKSCLYRLPPWPFSPDVDLARAFSQLKVWAADIYTVNSPKMSWTQAPPSWSQSPCSSDWGLRPWYHGPAHTLTQSLPGLSCQLRFHSIE